MNEFLNPKSMLTPGAAGAVMMLIANAITNQFPEFPFRYTALSISFLVGAIVFKADNIKGWERPFYWIFNSLIIFSVGVGTSNIGHNTSSNKIQDTKQSSILFFIESAKANDNTTPPDVTDTSSLIDNTQQQLKKANQEVEELKESNRRLKEENAIRFEQSSKENAELKQNKSFFNTW